MHRGHGSSAVPPQKVFERVITILIGLITHPASGRVFSAYALTDNTLIITIRRVSYLIGNKISKYDVSLAAGEVLTGETFGGKPVYMRLVDIGVLPNNTKKAVSTGITGADYIWIDPTYSMVFNAGASYPLPYNDPSDLSNGITARLTSSGASVIVHTGSNWSGYSAFVSIKYTKQ